MAGKKDIVEQALKLIAGGAKEAGPSVAERAAKNIDVFNTANRLGVDTNDIAKLQETKRLMDYHKGFMGDVRERAKSLAEIVQQMKASGAFPMEVGTRYTTEHSRRTGQAPWTVTNYYVDPKNPQGSYGYYVRRELPEGGYEESISKIRDPKLEALHGPEKWEELQRGFVPMTGPKVVKSSGGSIREGYGPGGWVDDVVKMAGKVVMGGGEKAVGIIPGTFPGKKLPRVDALANNVDKFVYHSGVAEDIPSMKHGVDPQIGPWVKEVLEGSAEDDLVNEIMENAVPVSWWSKRPDWAVMKVARKLGKNPKDVTPEELAQHGHVALIPKKDPEAKSMYWVGEQGLSSGPYSEVEDITGRKLKAYETDLYSGNYGPEGVERNEYITPRYVEPYLHLTGNELLDFLRKTGAYNKAHGGRIAKGPGGWIDDVVKMAGKVISGEGEDAAESALRAFAETKLKTPKGKPMRLYHLTPGNFSEFSVSPENRSGPVVFLSPYADFQPAYHQAAERGPNDEITSIFKEGANVMPVYADVRNPLILDSYEKIKEAQTKYQSGDRGFPYFVKPEAKAAMEADGYDGIIFGGNDPAPYRSETSTEGWNPHIGFQRNREEEIIVFDPKKVKSAISNTGKYDFTDPDITKAGGGSTSKPQRSMGGNNSISGALNVARGMNGGK